MARKPRTARADRRAQEREQIKALRRAFIARGTDPAEAGAIAEIFWLSLPDDPALRDAEVEAELRRDRG